MLKYRIVKIEEDLSTKYIIQRRFLWFFWIYVDGYLTSLYKLEEVKSELERFKRKNKKELVVVYKE